jgi:hypothetical protein
VTGRFLTFCCLAIVSLILGTSNEMARAGSPPHMVTPLQFGAKCNDTNFNSAKAWVEAVTTGFSVYLPCVIYGWGPSLPADARGGQPFYGPGGFVEEDGLYPILTGGGLRITDVTFRGCFTSPIGNFPACALHAFDGANGTGPSRSLHMVGTDQVYFEYSAAGVATVVLEQSPDGAVDWTPVVLPAGCQSDCYDVRISAGFYVRANITQCEQCKVWAWITKREHSGNRMNNALVNAGSSTFQRITLSGCPSDCLNTTGVAGQGPTIMDRGTIENSGLEGWYNGFNNGVQATDVVFRNTVKAAFDSNTGAISFTRGACTACGQIGSDANAAIWIATYRSDIADVWFRDFNIDGAGVTAPNVQGVLIQAFGGHSITNAGLDGGIYRNLTGPAVDIDASPGAQPGAITRVAVAHLTIMRPGWQCISLYGNVTESRVIDNTCVNPLKAFNLNTGAIYAYTAGASHNAIMGNRIILGPSSVGIRVEGDYDVISGNTIVGASSTVAILQANAVSRHDDASSNASCGNAVALVDMSHGKSGVSAAFLPEASQPCGHSSNSQQ